MITDLNVFVLAGGKSMRMGADKAFLPWQNTTLLAHALELARCLTAGVRIFGEKEKFAGHGAAVVEDIYRNRGPLAGIHAALSSTLASLNITIAVDMPFLETELLAFLAVRARESNAIVTVPHVGGRLQPLCAVYRREFVEIAEQSLRSGKNKIDPLFAQVKTETIEESELAGAGFLPAIFRNLNTPADLDAAKPG
jgi:molybdenum cofactor guanylyltransferase